MSWVPKDYLLTKDFLSQLRLSNNLIHAIPTLIGELGALRELLLDGNQIRYSHSFNGMLE
jgi:Leucine-rich repeat (LRR) protein